MVGAKQPVHWFLGEKGLDIQQEMSVWVGLPESSQDPIGPKSNRLHIDISRSSFSYIRGIFHRFL